MAKEKHSTQTFLLKVAKAIGVGSAAIAVCASLVYLIGFSGVFAVKYGGVGNAEATSTSSATTPPPVLDKVAYDTKLLYLAHVATSSPWYTFFLTGTTTKPAQNLSIGSSEPREGSAAASSTPVLKKQLWPVKTVYPNYGALLPFNRIVAYYGNFYSKGMGVLGQYPEEQMLAMLRATAASWQAADPTTPVVPAIDYIAVTAQASPGSDKMYRFRMPDSQIDKALAVAEKVHGIVILDIQVGDSSVPIEIPLLAKYLALPNVHLALDPEFDMPTGVAPGRVIGSMSAADINFAANFLATLVKANNLPPKILIIHRFTEDMVPNYKNIKPLPEVQIVMDMDGWGFKAKKINTYNSVVSSEPVQFTGFKLFYKNDLFAPSKAMMTPAEVLNLTPAPSFIQYQ
jgi:hypothetical protein